MKEPLRGTQIRRCKHKLTEEEEAVVEATTKHEVGVEIQDQMLERLLNSKNLKNMTQNNLNRPMVEEGTGSIEEERKDLIERGLNASIVAKLVISLQNDKH